LFFLHYLNLHPEQSLVNHQITTLSHTLMSDHRGTSGSKAPPTREQRTFGPFIIPELPESSYRPVPTSKMDSAEPKRTKKSDVEWHGSFKTIPSSDQQLVSSLSLLRKCDTEEMTFQALRQGYIKEHCEAWKMMRKLARPLENDRGRSGFRSYRKKFTKKQRHRNDDGDSKEAKETTSREFSPDTYQARSKGKSAPRSQSSGNVSGTSGIKHRRPVAEQRTDHTQRYTKPTVCDESSEQSSD